MRMRMGLIQADIRDRVEPHFRAIATDYSVQPMMAYSVARAVMFESEPSIR